jgi:hypothetical protein
VNFATIRETTYISQEFLECKEFIIAPGLTDGARLTWPDGHVAQQVRLSITNPTGLRLYSKNVAVGFVLLSYYN